MQRVLIALPRDYQLMRDIIVGACRAVAGHEGWSHLVLDPRFMSEAERYRPTAAIIMDLKNGIRSHLPAGLPTINVSHHLPEPPAPAVISDHAAVARLAFDHLRQSEYRSFGIAGLGAIGWAAARTAAFASLCSRQGLPCSYSEGKQSDAKMLATSLRPLGVFAVCDRRAAQVIHRAGFLGLAVPQQIGVVGVDDDPNLQAEAGLDLTSIDLDGAAIGREAVRLLIEACRGAASPPLTLIAPRRLMARATTRLTEETSVDALVQRALQHIDQHAHGRLTVGDIAAALGVPRRTLDHRFRATLGRSILDCIRGRRIAAARDLLAGGGIPVEEVSQRCGYKSRQRFPEDFKRVFGTTPGAWAQLMRSQGRPRTDPAATVT
jgi:LacI family transcriptional regulator